MAMHEETFNCVEHKLQTVGKNIENHVQTLVKIIENRSKLSKTMGKEIENQLQNQLNCVEHKSREMGKNIENQFQTVGKNIENQFNCIEHKSREVGKNIENQFQTVGKNIEDQFQIVGKNIENKVWSPFELNDTEIKKISVAIKTIEPTALNSSASSLHLSDDKDSELADIENKQVETAASESPTLCTEINSGEGLEKSLADIENKEIEKQIVGNKNFEPTALNGSALLLHLSDDKDSELADIENKKFETAASESPTLCTEINSGKGLEKSLADIEKKEIEKQIVGNKKIEPTALNGSAPSLHLLDDEDSELADIENKKLGNTASENPTLCTEIYSAKGLEEAFAFLNNAFSNDSLTSTENTSDTDSSVEQDFISESDAYNSHDSHELMYNDKHSEKTKEQTYVVEELQFDNNFAQLYSDECYFPVLCAKPGFYDLSASESSCDKEINISGTRDVYELMRERESEHRACSDETFIAEPNLSDDENSAPCITHSEFSSYDFCDSDWEII